MVRRPARLEQGTAPWSYFQRLESQPESMQKTCGMYHRPRRVHRNHEAKGPAPGTGAGLARARRGRRATKAPASSRSSPRRVKGPSRSGKALPGTPCRLAAKGSAQSTCGPLPRSNASPLAIRPARWRVPAGPSRADRAGRPEGGLPTRPIGSAGWPGRRARRSRADGVGVARTGCLRSRSRGPGPAAGVTRIPPPGRRSRRMVGPPSDPPLPASPPAQVGAGIRHGGMGPQEVDPASAEKKRPSFAFSPNCVMIHGGGGWMQDSLATRLTEIPGDRTEGHTPFDGRLPRRIAEHRSWQDRWRLSVVMPFIVSSWRGSLPSSILLNDCACS